MFCFAVTECEIQDGILKTDDVNKHCLVYKRRFKLLSDALLSLKDIPRFIDVIKTDKVVNNAGLEIIYLYFKSVSHYILYMIL